jgi:hypothetical protein
MVKMINMYTGTAMYVVEDRVQKYLEVGHRQVVDFAPAKRTEKKPAARKRATRK